MEDKDTVNAHALSQDDRFIEAVAPRVKVLSSKNRKSA
jgi:hypothetical protein